MSKMWVRVQGHYSGSFYSWGRRQIEALLLEDTYAFLSIRGCC
ncbi:MAG: hypothetical protein ABWW69_07305 [Pyrodictiaceae archaeon]